MTERRAGRYVRLELVWRGDRLQLERGVATGWVENRKDGKFGSFSAFSPNPQYRLGIHPTRAEAERAVEDAVIARMGGGA